MRFRHSPQRTTRIPDKDGNHVIPLNELSSGETGIVQELRGGREFTRRVVTLGFTIGAPVTVIRNMGHGPLVISVLNTNIALGQVEASRILVKSQ